MNCPEHILVHTKNFILTLYGNYDIAWRYVPLSWKLNPFRYEIIIRRPKFIRINKEGRARVCVSNFLFRHIRPRLCRWFGIHQKFRFRDGDKLCMHCNKGRDS